MLGLVRARTPSPASDRAPLAPSLLHTHHIAHVDEALVSTAAICVLPGWREGGQDGRHADHHRGGDVLAYGRDERCRHDPLLGRGGQESGVAAEAGCGELPWRCGGCGGRSCGGWAALGSLGGAGRGGARAVAEAGPFGRRPPWREDPPRRKPGLGGVEFVCAADPSRR
eukprot:COSAG04_NODE_18_length_39571_cov_50.788128_22_plen_169_part_00